MRLIVATIGEEATRKLMVELGGMSIYIPRIGRAELADALREEAFDVKIVAAKYRVSQSKLYSILKEIRTEQWAKKRQMTLFDIPHEDEPNK